MTLGVIALTMGGLLSACTKSVLLLPLEPGAAHVEKPGYGLVLGRIAVIRDGEEQLSALPSFPKQFGWKLRQVSTDTQYVVSPLTQNGLFLLALPAGDYEVIKLMYEERAGEWEGRLPARFSVQSDGVAYLGTWTIRFTNLGPSSRIKGEVVNQLDEAREDLKETYTGIQKPIIVSLLESAQEGYLSLLRPRAEQ